MIEKVRIPEIRFAGYTELWKQRMLGDVSEIITGGTPSTQNKSYWLPKEIPWLSSGEVNKKRISNTDNMISRLGLDNSSASWIKENSVLIALAGQGRTRGTVAINNISLTTNQSLAAFVLNHELHCEFLFQNLNNRYDELRGMSSADGSRGGLNKQILTKLEIQMPNFSEQLKIGLLFKDLDNLITLQQSKIEKLEIVKKSMLIKMLPKEGFDVPEIRFDGFKDAWELCKLDQLFLKGGSGGTPSSTNIKFYDGNIPFLGISDITNSNGFINKTEKLITKEGLENSSAWIVPKGAISLAMYASVGKLAILNVNSATSQAFYNMVFEKNITRDFVFHRLVKASITNEWAELISTGTQANLNSQKVKSFIVLKPKAEKEQEHIGVFFNQIDELISLNRNRLNILRNIKQSMLNKMFVSGD